MGEINLYIDRRGKNSVSAISNPAIYTVPSIALYDKQKWNIRVLDATGNAESPYFEQPNLNGAALRMAVCSGGASTAVLASETNWTWDDSNLLFYGTIDLSQSALVTAMSGVASLACELELSLVIDTVRTHIFTADITVIRVADIVATPSAVQTDSYYTAAESGQIFAKRRNTGAITLVSIDGLSEVTLTCVDGKLVEQGNAV